ncbi:unnamed protein product [Ceutorhynchus assimilis]|uniref:Nuclear factor of activated T-cells 5 n=1 Tax=Ceutorhynchus assimilis TaxID=467358 RepID=A0A9N9MPQ2_9CUCU|nr:unnamed protein product [Ceutorhynchus assimilis]
MTLCTQLSTSAPRPQRRPGRPPGGKKIMAPGKLRSTYRRSLDPCDNSNDSGLGFDHHADPHHHTMTMSERLAWTGERSGAKRLCTNIKVEHEEANGNYCFPNAPMQCKDNNNISLIRTAPSGSVPALNISNSSRASSGRAVPRCTPIIGRQAPTAPISLVTQLTSTSRYGDVALTIIKQPEQQHRARYQTEGSRGAVKDREGNGFPIVQLTGYYKPAVLQVYIGTDVGKVSPHMFYQACKVSGKNSTPCVEKKLDGTCVIELALDPTKDMCATCDCVGILKERNVDVEHRFPEQLGNRSKKKSTRCRMIFRTTITHDNDSTETLQVCSQPIVCTQPPGIPEICKKSLTSCPAGGGLELFVLGKNFLKDTKVYFQQFDDGRVCWEQAVAPDKEYLQQTHFVCVVPPYHRPNITEPVPVRLCVVSSGKTSESHQFVYTPINGTASVHMDAHAQRAPSFKGAIWSSSTNNNSTFHKHQQDLDMMPPPETNLVPLATRRPSINMPSTSNDAHSPPLHSLKQEYIDENSQGSLSDSMDVMQERYRPISESSLDVNHDSNISMINENSMMSHLSENSNLSMSEESMEMVRRNSLNMCDNAVMNEPNDRAMLPTQVMDLRMKLPMNASINDYVTTASSLRKFGIEHSSAPLTPQSAQSVANYLTKIETKQLSTAQAMSSLIPSQTTQFLTSQQPFLPEATAISTIAKSEAAAIAEQAMMANGTTTTANANTTLTTALEGSISTPINAEKLDEILNSTLESHMMRSQATKTTNGAIVTTQDVMMSSESPLLVPSVNVINSTNLTNGLLVATPQDTHSAATLSPEVILNSQLSPSLMCRNSPSVPQESLIGASTLSAICQSGTTNSTDSNLLSGSMPTVTTQESVALLSSEPEKAVLLEAAVDFLKTQKKICELTTTAQDIISIPSTVTVTDSTALGMENTMASSFMPFASSTQSSVMMSKSISDQKRDYIPIAIKDIATTTANDRKNEDRMIPQSFTSLTENELINLINPTCFDQGNAYHH